MFSKKRLWVLAGALGVNLACHLLTVFLNIPTTTLKVVGSYVAVIASWAALCFLPFRFQLIAQVFVAFAASVGNCMNMYTHWSCYDLLIHYLSGVVLASAGWQLDKRLLFALLFSWAGAGLWEIFEFSCDCILNAGMQGAATDTMTDMIAGFLGGVTWLITKKLTIKGDSSILG